MEALVARGVPESAKLIAATALVDLTGTTTIGIRFVAVSAVITEATVLGAVLPADGTNTIVTCLAVGIAESTILLLVIRARGERLTGSAAISHLPA
jgi:hypothetical protein